MQYNKVLLFVLTLFFMASSCSKSSSENIYTLYRGGAIAKDLRIHYATFETKGEADDWNKSNCEEVSDFLNEKQKIQAIPVRFWCEKGSFRE